MQSRGRAGSLCNGETTADPKGEDTLVLLGALCLFLAALEYLIPKPLPFIRIGLANLPLLLALDILSPRHFALLTLLKIAGTGIVGGTIFSYVFLFSLGGSAASALAMYGLGVLRRRGPRVLRPSLAGIGAAGSLCSTGTQLLLARFLIFGEGARYLIPPFLAMALGTGLALGLFCEVFCGRSRWYALRVRGPGGSGPGLGSPDSGVKLDPQYIRIENPQEFLITKAPKAHKGNFMRREDNRRNRRARWDALFDSRELAIAGFLGALLFLLNPTTAGRALQFAFFWFCAWASGRKNRPLLTLLVMAGVLLVNLLAPYGRVVAEFGPLRVTTGSLVSGLRKGITLEGLLMLSGAVIRGRPFGAGRPARPGRKAGLAALAAGFFRLLGESLAVFALIGGGQRVRPGHLATDLDRLLLNLDSLPREDRARPNPRTDESQADGSQTGGNRAGRPENQGARGRRKGRLLLVLSLLAVAALTLLPALVP
ncbi:MAG: Gx transporter family protein [Treponema sp.]|jgi:heptaprenyl diphosphate synthase|nr:Gx transporter family protein [Treponema sp.]